MQGEILPREETCHPKVLGGGEEVPGTGQVPQQFWEPRATVLLWLEEQTKPRNLLSCSSPRCYRYFPLEDVARAFRFVECP